MYLPNGTSEFHQILHRLFEVYVLLNYGAIFDTMYTFKIIAYFFFMATIKI